MIVAKEYSKRINSPKAMEIAWESFKDYCDHRTVTRTEFSQKLSEFVTAVIPAPVTYTVKGFCKFIGMSEANFYITYDKNEKFKSVITRMKEECEVDAREKFENGTINSRLAGLWMSNYGYSTKAETNMEMKNKVVIVDDLDE
jgi:hypothetical protein